MNLVMEKSQGKLQNDAHLHDIIEEIKELAKPLWISSVSMLQAHNQNFNTKATTFKDITISDLRDLKVSLSLIYAARNISHASKEELNQRLSILSGKNITSYEEWLLHENRGIICEMIDEFRKNEWVHSNSK
ncbi:hypothetical protein P9133_02155 [Bacillus thuringiensis]|uniref:Uncharacterized protein n=1 Tax=Bacillus thuringiensis HD-771 TaxID=1218175 RepID=A0A9W3JGG9_BACTU|nr:hypothetical protein [Bacillus thuringiensis]AFQ19682.1 hypothetical protein BTG_31728 [Bacillus thuringiensis HD-771]MEC3263286.1 hypothetical protein [Bacillus thuringiensis]MEC3510489.1 hypothetical protein [Bacillus thuringiensis]MED2073691.1 hypothetical protein [Bacillus thuringiensis]MED2222618.1 hypothetical protein [Bacillus thuringiensis]